MLTFRFYLHSIKFIIFSLRQDDQNLGISVGWYFIKFILSLIRVIKH